MKYSTWPLLVLIILIYLLNSSCKKQKTNCEDGTFSKGYIIGFDPCTAHSSGDKGYVIKFENNLDTSVVYFKLPSNIQIPDSLFSNYLYDYLFPQGFRDKFIIYAKFRAARSEEVKTIFCYPLADLGDFIRATKGRQTVLECIK